MRTPKCRQCPQSMPDSRTRGLAILAGNLVVLLLAGCSPPGVTHSAAIHSTDLGLTEVSASPLACLDGRAETAAEPRGGWLPTKGGALDYNPDSPSGTPVPSAPATRMGARFAATSGHHLVVTEATEIRTSKCEVVRWALLHDKAQDSAYLALFHLGRPVDPNSFPLIGASTGRLRLHNGTEILSSQTSDGGVVTIVATRSDGLTALLQIRRAGDDEGIGYPTTVTVQGPGASTLSGPSPISEAGALRDAVKVLSEGASTN
jgi:hypothetical protein